MNDTSVSGQYEIGLKKLHGAIDNLLERFDEHIQKVAGDFERPAEEVLHNLLSPIRKGHWSFNDQREKNRWVDLLNEINLSRNKLQLTLAAHGKWQKLHGQLKRVDKANELLDEMLIGLKDEKTSMDSCKAIVDEFTQTANTVFEEYCEPGASTLKLGLCDINTDDGLVNLLRQSDLETFTQTLDEFYLSIADVESLSEDDMHKLDNKSRPAERLYESTVSYSEFRGIFDKSFYSVDNKLKDMCDRATGWIDELYELLDDIHASILKYEEHVNKELVREAESER